VRSSLPAKPNLISLVVCTRNRAAKLRRTLEFIWALEIPSGADYELIVADNGSADDTAAVCQSIVQRFGGRLRSVFVEIPGKSRAANVGIETSRGEIVAFLDDDILPQRDWLCWIWSEFSSDPGLGAISGRVELASSVDLPVGIRRRTERTEFRSVGDAFGLFIGCNFAIRRGLLDRIGCFDLNLGPGTQYESSEDADLFYRAWKAGGKLVYVPTLFVFHDHGRRSEEASRQIRRGYLIGRGAFYARHVLRADLAVGRAIYWEMRTLLFDLLRRKERRDWQQLSWLLRGLFGYAFMKVTSLLRGPW
jgi:glycosyltransferase involved in cell wall biosynthesis